ncbi:hypothetical protein EVAR_34271_1 [Eumeta japonica]|uniref:Uncharacterized protein n=1 Tax=Eumeta variegata TaxID=151549 RepID=A0A4C1VZV3_EUMVA|nr:hypothetical protein EVAR_34271_1 [Eumeta japonica]
MQLLVGLEGHYLFAAGQNHQLGSLLPTSDKIEASNRKKPAGIDEQKWCGFSHDNNRPRTSSATQRILREFGAHIKIRTMKCFHYGVVVPGHRLAPEACAATIILDWLTVRGFARLNFDWGWPAPNLWPEKYSSTFAVPTSANSGQV